MITQDQIDLLNTFKWSYKFKKCPAPAVWTAQEYYSPKEWHIQATFKIGRASVCPDITEPEGRPGWYDIKADYVKANNMVASLKAGTGDFNAVPGIVNGMLENIEVLIGGEKDGYAGKKAEALEKAKKMFGEDFTFTLEKKTTGFPILMHVGLEGVAPRMAELAVYENHGTAVSLSAIVSPDDRDMGMIVELLKYRGLKHKMSEV